jgi:hypothetical protein
MNMNPGLNHMKPVCSHFSGKDFHVKGNFCFFLPVFSVNMGKMVLISGLSD